MAATALADVIVPEVFNPYVVQKSIKLNAFFQSGVMSDMTALPSINEQMMSADPGVDGGGATVNMPFFNDLSGADEVIDDGTDLTINNITTGKDVAAKLLRAKVFGSFDIAADLAGSDPMTVIADRFAEYWTRRYQDVLIEVLKGAMGTTKSGASMAANVLDISALSGAAANLDGESFIDATAKLGDHNSILSAVGVHSAVEAQMRKDDLIQYEKTSEAAELVPFYQGKRVIVDDRMPVSNGTYTTYLFGNGAVGWAAGTPRVPTEINREPLKGGGQEYIVNRNKFLLHIRGIKWDPGSGVPAKATPSNAELGAAANWARVYDPKLIRVVQFKHKIG